MSSFFWNSYINYGCERGLAIVKSKTILLTSLLITLLFTFSSTDQIIHAQTEPTAVYVLSVDGTIELGLTQYVTRGLNLAKQDDAAVLLEVNTFGGRVDAATEIRDLILRMETPVITFVRERAISAGALISIAAPHIAMAQGSSIGAAEPRPLDEKNVAYLRSEFESTAERHGRDPRIAGAMVDANVVIEDLVDQGQILSLTANQALEFEYADVIANYRNQVLAHYELDHLEVVEIERNWAERFAGFLTDPTVSQLLLTIGFLGIVIELISPGWGIPGFVGIVAMGLFFGGRIFSGLAGFEVMIFFVLGLVLLFLELFVIPGFGVIGIVGLLSIFGSIFLSYGNFYTALSSIIIALLISIIVIVIFWKKFRKSSAWERFILTTREDKDQGYTGAGSYQQLVDKEGVTTSQLRPSGIVSIDGQRYDVVSEGGYIPINTEIKVVKVEGNRVVVRKIDK